MLQTRRSFLSSAAWIAAAAPTLQVLAGCASGARAAIVPRTATIALTPDPNGLLDLPNGFKYVIVSRAGDRMSDGLIEPGAHDGMSAFPVAGNPNRCRIVRNHELGPNDAHMALSAFAGAAESAYGQLYDRTRNGRPFPGGTTTLEVDMHSGKVIKSHLSLAGTAVNCCGGPTPWGSWLTCEETEITMSADAGQNHGYVFEVPASATGRVEPKPLIAMGRFRHEAAAVDPATGIVYMTEDQGDGLIYRFLPAERDVLIRGGRLQALALVKQAGADTRNWSVAQGGDPMQTIAAGERLAVRWIDMDHVDAPDSDLRMRGRQRGAAIFARGEGMAFGSLLDGDAIYFACTSGGAVGRGQIWRYTPSRFEGRSDETKSPGLLELFVESAGENQFDFCDNIVASPLGDIVLCEDGPGDQYVRGVTPDGLIYPIARNAHAEKSEFCGACFAPDGRTLFVNVQRPGVTFAITGPWGALRRNQSV